MRLDKFSIGMILFSIILCVLSYILWGRFVYPFYGLTVAQVIEKPLIDVIIGAVVLITAPEVVILAIYLFFLGLGVFYEF